MAFTLHSAATPPGYGEALLPLEDAKRFLRIEEGDDESDALLEALRDAAIDMVEQYANLRLAPCSGLEATFDGFAQPMRFGVGPAFSVQVTGVAYDLGSDTVVLTGPWRMGVGGALTGPVSGCWPSRCDLVRVTFDAGYPVGQAPATLIHAARLFLGHLFVNREAVVSGAVTGQLPLGFTAMCDRYRMPVL